MLKLKLFGTPSIEAHGRQVTGRATQGRRLAMLAVLVSARGRAVTRDKLLALIWPESPTDRARHQLSDDVYILRSALGEDVIRSSGDELALDPGAIESDAEMFERLLDEERHEAAVGLFTGPLLEGFHLPDSAEFAHWLDAERARLGLRYAAALEALAERSEASGQFEAAVSWWRRLAAQDPLSGRVTLRLMRALEAWGHRADALKQARIHSTLLREEFDAEPDPEVTAFAERLRSAPPARPAPEPVVMPPAPSHLDDVAPAAPRRTAPARTPRRWSYAAAAAALLMIAILAVRGIAGRTPERPPIARSVAVLPFVNMSPDPENVYFSDGLSEQIITALSQIDGLRVAARTSSFALRDGRLDVRAIGDTLGVAAVLEGSVRKDGNTLRITAQLIDASTGYHLWSEEYDREPADVFAVQQEIARAIAAALELRLAGGRAVSAARQPGLDAYDLYLRGLFHRNSLSADALREAMGNFDSAIALEPDFARAHAAKASVMGPLILFGHVPREEGLRELRTLTTRALELDPDLGEAHAALGMLRLFFDWEWDAAEQALRRAIELNPSDAHAYHHLANHQRVIGRLHEAITTRERAVELDPLNARTVILLGNDYMIAADYDNALVQFRRAMRLDPAHTLLLGSGPFLPSGTGAVYLLQGRDAEAVEEHLRIATLRGATAGELSAMRRAFAASGMPGFWRSWLEMDRRQSDGVVDPLRAAKLWLLAGDTARSLDWLERAYAERNPALVFLQVDPAFANLRSHPRVARILKEMKFPER
ncbi:MAG TPA: BTAD domain-containing putative transcriptional regulator [Gemmatimonadaceae bacterium]|nr:BTAD domain-containing putative transcriptional regulator [Gemmatimonadaceae bacterium]